MNIELSCWFLFVKSRVLSWCVDFAVGDVPIPSHLVRWTYRLDALKGVGMKVCRAHQFIA
jgi:hypothetical protein